MLAGAGETAQTRCGIGRRARAEYRAADQCVLCGGCDDFVLMLGTEEGGGADAAALGFR